MPKTFLLSALLLTFILASSLAEASKHECTNPRPTSSQCERPEYLPVCAYYSNNCPFSICGRTEYDDCSACTDKNVSYYYDGDCPLNAIVNACYPDECVLPDGSVDISRKDYFDPVCGIEKSCRSKSRNCLKTFNNNCDSCAKSRYPFYQTGPCEHDRHYCPKERPDSCSGEYETVCALFNDVNNITHWVTVNSWCNACKDPQVSYYIKGECGKPLYNETYCLTGSRPEICTEEYNPVCSFYTTSNGSIEHKISGNACNACSEQNVLYHTPGECVTWCNRHPLLAVDCIGNLEPVCGSYQDNGVTKQVSLRNGCVGCHYNVINVDTYTEGLCPGDDGILCAYNGIAYLDGLLEPVCALTNVNCTSSSCRKTFGDSVMACRNETYVKYIPGVCPGEYGVPCTDFRDNPISALPRYTDVCGYESNQCNNDSCRETYDSQFDACANPDVLYFTAGPCS